MANGKDMRGALGGFLFLSSLSFLSLTFFPLTDGIKRNDASVGHSLGLS